MLSISGFHSGFCSVCVYCIWHSVAPMAVQFLSFGGVDYIPSMELSDKGEFSKMTSTLYLTTSPCLDCCV